jgi:hypothetical protein
MTLSPWLREKSFLIKTHQPCPNIHQRSHSIKFQTKTEITINLSKLGNLNQLMNLLKLKYLVSILGLDSTQPLTIISREIQKAISSLPLIRELIKSRQSKTMVDHYLN